MNRGDLRSNQEKRSYWAHQNELNRQSGHGNKPGIPIDMLVDVNKIPMDHSKTTGTGDVGHHDSDGSGNKLLIAGAVAIVGVGVFLATNNKFRKRVSDTIKNFAADFFGNYEGG